MSIVDIICIPEETFYELQKTQADEKTKSLYETLISGHACFSVQPQPYEPHHSRPNNKHHRTHRPHHHSSNSYTSASIQNGQNTMKRSKKPNEDPMAVFKGLLNVLNTSNFEKIQRKFKMAITDVNMTSVCHLLLETATQQAFFIDNYVRLLNGCRVSHPQINSVVAEFINSYMENKEFVPLVALPDDFVEQQKLKKQTIGKAILIIELLKARIPAVLVTHQLFVYAIMDSLQKTSDLHKTDLLLSSLQEVKKRCKVTIDQNALKHLMFNHNDTRILFMFEQLL